MKDSKGPGGRWFAFQGPSLFGSREREAGLPYNLAYTPPMNITISILYQGMLLQGHATSIKSLIETEPAQWAVHLQGWFIGTLSNENGRWTMDQPIDGEFVAALGRYVVAHSSLKPATI